MVVSPAHNDSLTAAERMRGTEKELLVRSFVSGWLGWCSGQEGEKQEPCAFFLFRSYNNKDIRDESGICAKSSSASVLLILFNSTLLH